MGVELGVVIAKIEHMLESLIDALSSGAVLKLPLRSRTTGRDFFVKFPGATEKEVKKFTSLLLVLHICHEALVNDYIVTKRNIYYQDPVLFGSQEYVDRLVDDVAFTFGVGRDALNIVAAAKGLVVGDLTVHSRDGLVATYDGNDEGTLVPRARSITQLNLGAISWVLIIEKEATFRSLAACQFYATASAGRGILVTGKGYPDLSSRQFLYMMRDAHPLVPMFAVVDYDPDGVAIFSTYTSGSQSLGHEENATVPDLIWLGPQSQDVMALSRTTSPRNSAHKPLVLTRSDRRKATRLLGRLAQAASDSQNDSIVRHELQMMLYLNIKSEIQMMDDNGDLAGWLDGKLCGLLGMTDA